MNLKRKISVLAVLLIIIIASISGVPVVLGAGPDNSVSSNNQSEEDALLFDASIYAKQNGITVDEAIRRFQLQDYAGVLDAELSSKESNTFAGLWIEHTPKFQIVVQFTRDAAETIKPYLREGIANVIEVRTAKASLIDLQSTQSSVLSALRSSGILADTEIDVQENRIKVYTADRIRFDNALRDGRLTLPDNVDIITVETLAKPTIDIYGGLSLSGGGTSGFAVKTDTGTKGITTAGHASNSEWYTIFPLPFQQEKVETYYDIQWHTCPLLTVKNQIRISSNGTTRSITATKSRANQVVGEWVAKYGRTTEYTGGYIGSKTATLSYIPNCQPTFIRVDPTGGYNPLVEEGDSGGPWFFSNTAYGTTCAKSAGGYGYYMAVDYVSGVGVTVMTAP